MAIHRYWRIVGIQTQTNSDIELSEFRFYNLGSLADTSCIVTSTIVPFSGNLSYLTDNSSTNVVLWKYSAWSQSGFSINYDFGSGQGVEFPKFRIGSGSSVSTWVQDCIVQWSIDNINWTGYFSLTNIHYPGAYSLTTLPDSDVPDVYYSNTVLLLNGNGTNGSTSIIDSNTNAKIVTAFGDTKISTTQSKFGASSIYFDGSGDYLSIPNSTDFNFGTGDFTIEMWFYLTSDSGVAANGLRRACLLSSLPLTPSFLDGCFMVTISGSSSITGTGILVDWFNGGVESYVYDTSTPISKNVWHHVAVDRHSGGTPAIFLDGVKINTAATTNTSAPININTSFQDIRIGGKSWWTSDEYFTGYIDDLRITKGIARYTANFTPPTSELSIYPITLDTYTARFTKTIDLPNRILPSVELPIGSAYSQQQEYVFLDAYYGGNGLIVGTTKIKNTVSNIPVMKRVVLIDERSKVVIAERWSDSLTGYFEFKGIRSDILYTLLSYDHTGAFNAVVAVSVIPTIIT